MKDITATRRQNLKALICTFPSQVAFAEAVGKAPQQIGGMLSGSKSFGNKITREIETRLNLPHGYLDQTEDERKYVKLSSVDEPTKEDWVRIPVLDIEASCGYGTEGGLPSIVGGIDIAPEFLLTMPGVISHNGLHVVNAHGDSMEPTIMDKSFCVVDTNQTRIMSEGIYCLTAGGQIYIKRVQRNLDGSMILISDNNIYLPQTIDKVTMENTTVIGRIVYVYNGLPL